MKTKKKKIVKSDGGLKMLTLEQDNFCLYVVEGMNNSEAYRKAFQKSSRWVPCTIHSKSCRLRARNNIQARIQEIQEAVQSANVATAQELAEFLTSIIRTPVGSVDETSKLAQEVRFDSESKTIKMPDKLSAVEKLAKLKGYNAPDLSENRTLNVNVNLDEKELMKIAMGEV